MSTLSVPSSEEKSEAVAASTATASETQNLVDQNKDTDSRKKLTNPPSEDKHEDVVFPAEDENEPGKITKEQASNPVPSIGVGANAVKTENYPITDPVNEPPPVDIKETNETTKKGGRSRPPGSKNRAGGQKADTKKQRVTVFTPDHFQTTDCRPRSNATDCSNRRTHTHSPMG